MNFRSLFVDKDKLVMVNMELAMALNSLDEAIVLNQLNYWIERNKDAKRNLHDGHYWVYNSYESWKKQDFPVWSATKIKRIFTSLEGKGIVLSANYNKFAIDKTKWYTIDYKKLKEFIEKHMADQNEKPEDQNEKTINADDQTIDQNDQTFGQNETPIPETNSRNNTTDTTNKDYNSETTAEASKQDFEDKAEAFSTKKKPTPHVPKKKTYSELKQLEQNMIKRFSEIASEYDISDTCSKNITNAFKHYLYRYTKKTGKIHPILTSGTLVDIFETLAVVGDSEYHHFENVAEIEPDENGVGYLEKIVDAYFDSEHRNETDWHISHFVAIDYLEKTAQHIVEY